MRSCAEKDANLRAEYAALTKAVADRGTGNLRVDSIIIPTSFAIILFALDQKGQFIAAYIPLLAIVIITIPYNLHKTSNDIDEICWDRIKEIECVLDISGHRGIHEKIKDTELYKNRRDFWSKTFRYLYLIYTLISIGLFLFWCLTQ